MMNPNSDCWKMSLCSSSLGQDKLSSSLPPDPKDLVRSMSLSRHTPARTC